MILFSLIQRKYPLTSLAQLGVQRSRLPGAAVALPHCMPSVLANSPTASGSRRKNFASSLPLPSLCKTLLEASYTERTASVVNGDDQPIGLMASWSRSGHRLLCAHGSLALPTGTCSFRWVLGPDLDKVCNERSSESSPLFFGQVLTCLTLIFFLHIFMITSENKLLEIVSPRENIPFDPVFTCCRLLVCGCCVSLVSS